MASFGLGRTIEELAGEVWTTPWVAAADGNLPLLQTALSSLQLPVTCQDENGYTLLQAAVSYNQAHIWQWLSSQAQFNVHQVDQEGDSALHYAISSAAARFLVETSGMNPALRNKDGQTALEKKRQELEEMRQDEDFEETDDEYVQLRHMAEYLASLTTVSQ